MQFSWSGLWTVLRLGHQPLRGDQDEPSGLLETSRPHPLPGAPNISERARYKLTRKILIPTDFSPASNCALESALAVASQCHALLTVLHVINVNTQSDFGPSTEVWARLRGKASTQIRQVAERLDGRADVQTILEEGVPGDAIVRKSYDVDLIILGNGGRKTGWFSKRTVQRVLDQSNCSVMVVGSGQPTCGGSFELRTLHSALRPGLPTSELTLRHI